MSFGGTMNLRIKCTWILAGFAAMTAMLAGEGFVAAGTTSTGIIITKANSTPVNDPQYEYLFQITVFATPTDPLSNGSSLTITNLTGIVPGFPISAGSTVNGWYGTVGTQSATFIYFNQGAPPIEMTESYSLAEFFAGPVNLSSPPTPIIGYTGSLDGGTVTNTGSVQVSYVPSAVPEPSSAILLFAACGTLSLIWLRSEQRRNHLRASTAI